MTNECFLHTENLAQKVTDGSFHCFYSNHLWEPKNSAGGNYAVCIFIYLFIATNRDLFQSKLLSYSILEESYHLQLRWNDSNSPVQLQLHFDLYEVDVQIR